MGLYRFGPFELDSTMRRLRRDGAAVPLAGRHVDVLSHLLAHAGEVQSKDVLIAAGWQHIAVTDNSLEQAIAGIRRALGPAPDGESYIETVPREGYRFRGEEVVRRASRATDTALDDLLAPHRAWIEGRAALETLERDGILRAREAFAKALRHMPDEPMAHVGLANACVMQFEMTRTDDAPDVGALEQAAGHAREACRLDPKSGEAWATLGFVLSRVRSPDAAAAGRRATTLEPDNWRHHVRLAYGSWGEERLRAAHRALALLPGFPLAHWLAATVHVARQALDDAERELAHGIAALEGEHGWQTRFSAVGLCWLQGLIALARDDETAALAAFERELAGAGVRGPAESGGMRGPAEAGHYVGQGGHLYARECGANTCYAIGALRLRQTRMADAREAFSRALALVPGHPLARIALAAADASGGRTMEQGADAPGPAPLIGAPPGVEAAIARAAALVLGGRRTEAARLVDAALAAAPQGASDGWTLPVEPLLDVRTCPDVWGPALIRLRARAA